MYNRSLGIDYFDTWVVYRINGKAVVVITAGDAKSYMEEFLYDKILPSYEKNSARSFRLTFCLLLRMIFIKSTNFFAKYRTAMSKYSRKRSLKNYRKAKLLQNTGNIFTII